MKKSLIVMFIPLESEEISTSIRNEITELKKTELFERFDILCVADSTQNAVKIEVHFNPNQN